MKAKKKTGALKDLGQFTVWLNNKHIRYSKTQKPCHQLGWCPYGQLVEEFPLKRNGAFSCEVFGHDCPAFYHREDLSEGGMVTEIMNRGLNTLKRRGR